MKAAAAGMILVLLAGCASGPPATPASALPASLEGTSWRLVQLTVDGANRAAIERSRYTMGFGSAGVLNVRFDCNRGRGSWNTSAPGDLQFGPLALTRAMCPVGSLHDELVRQWPNVRSYLFKDGRLFLSTADGGSLEFEPAP